MGDSEEEFEDAVEIIPGTELTLETAINECKAAVDLFFNNRFKEARALLSPWVGRSMYHTIGDSVLQFLEAVLTFDHEIITKTATSLKACIHLCNRHRRKGSLTESIGKMIRRRNYDNYSAVEVHAELCYAEALLLKSLLSFIEDETLVNLLKAGMKLRTCFNCYKECNNILKFRHWSNEFHKIHFESGVHVGIGAFNLMISFLPHRLIKVLEFIGFSGSKELGLSELLTGYELNEGVRHVLSVMSLLTYNLFVLYILGHEEGDLTLSNEILQKQLETHPNGACYLFLKGRLELMKGNLKEANRYYLMSWESQNVWPQFHHLCHWELMWSNSISLNWDSSIHYANILIENSRWSKCIYAYSKISAMLMKDCLSSNELQEIEYLAVSIPDWKQKFVGKSIPMEKFCIKRCSRYITQKSLVLPAIELMYLWNYFKILGKQWNNCQEIYKLILNALGEYDRGKYSGMEYEFDNKALLLLLKGACLLQMKSYLQSEECFHQVISMSKNIKEDTFIIPYSLLELAIVYFKQGLTDKALETLEDVKKNYSGYSLESRLHFRIHSAYIDFSTTVMKTQVKYLATEEDFPRPKTSLVS